MGPRWVPSPACGPDPLTVNVSSSPDNGRMRPSAARSLLRVTHNDDQLPKAADPGGTAQFARVRNHHCFAPLVGLLPEASDVSPAPRFTASKRSSRI